MHGVPSRPAPALTVFKTLYKFLEKKKLGKKEGSHAKLLIGKLIHWQTSDVNSDIKKRTHAPLILSKQRKSTKPQRIPLSSRLIGLVIQFVLTYIHTDIFAGFLYGFSQVSVKTSPVLDRGYRIPQRKLLAGIQTTDHFVVIEKGGHTYPPHYSIIVLWRHIIRVVIYYIDLR